MPRRSLAVLASALLLTVAVASPARAADPDTTAPSIPTGVRAVDVTETSLTLTWDASTDDVGVAGYHVQWAYTDVVYSRRTERNSLTVTGLAKSHTYQFWVYAFDAAGNNSRSSATFKIIMPPGDSSAPTTPTNFAVSAITETTATVSWTASGDNVGVAQYEIVRVVPDKVLHLATVPGQFGGLATWKLIGLATGERYDLAIRASDDAGNVSDLSNQISFRTTGGPDVTAPTRPGTPTAIVAYPANLVKLTWAPSTDDSGSVTYVVQELLGETNPVVATTATTTATFGPVDATRSHTYVVSARDAAGNTSGWSSPVVVRVPATCTVTYRVVSQWGGQFQGSVSIRTGVENPVNGWTLKWTFPAGQQVVNAWQVGKWSQDGDTVTVSDAGWNASISSTQSRDFGFIAGWGTTNTAPTGFTLNGRPCATA